MSGERYDCEIVSECYEDCLLNSEVNRAIMALRPEGHPDRISISEQRKLLEEALRLTLPLDLDAISSWPAAILSINELRSLMMIALCYTQEGKIDQNLAILSYIRSCLEITETDPAYYADIHAQLAAILPEHRNSTTK